MANYIILKIGGGINNTYIPAFEGHQPNRIPEKDFYPLNALTKQGEITLHLAGVGAFKVDGVKDYQLFRLRNQGNVGKFYQLHDLNKDDSVVVERISERIYSIYPYRAR